MTRERGKEREKISSVLSAGTHNVCTQSYEPGSPSGSVTCVARSQVLWTLSAAFKMHDQKGAEQGGLQRKLTGFRLPSLTWNAAVKHWN